jgi:outer membrane receptor for ferrienterochelin and colicin
MRTVYYSFNEKLSLEPSAIVRYKLASNSHVQFSYGVQSQMVQPQFYFAKSEKGIYINQNLDFLTSENISLSFNTRLKNDLRINVEAFWQDYSNVYYQTINTPQVVIVSLLDDLNTLNGISKSNKGTANSKGFTLGLNQNLLNGLFWQANIALFDARFKDGLGTDRSLSYNSRYTTNALVGKEWIRGSNRNRFFGVSGRTILRGGFWMPTDKEKWAQGKSYFRTDLNVYFKRNRKNWQSTLQLDIQNVTNRENEWSLIYDRLQGRYLSKKQLGLLPNLAYKVEF